MGKPDPEEDENYQPHSEEEKLEPPVNGEED